MKTETSFQLRKFSPPSLPKVDAYNLLDLAKAKGVDASDVRHKASGELLGELRSIDHLVQALQHGEELSALEWSYLLREKQDWDQRNPDAALATSLEIWEAANHDEGLRRRLLWGMLLFYCGTPRISPFISEAFESSSVYREDSLAVDLLKRVNQGESVGRAIAEQSMERQQPPASLLAQAGLPKGSIATKLALGEAVKVISERASLAEHHKQWFLKCLHAMDSDTLVDCVENLLPILKSKRLDTPDVLGWLRDRFSPWVENSLWERLSSPAKKYLRKYIGDSNYNEFQKWVELLCDSFAPGDAGDRPRRQLRSRSNFWANYSNSFERFRILLPRESISIMGSSVLKESKVYNELTPDGSVETEIGIFDLGHVFVVEFFRGPGSETRLFHKSSINIDLCLAKNLSIRRIRALGGEYHDHVIAWQWSCEQWLRKSKIHPNEGTKVFKGLPLKYASYSPFTGLPEPDLQKERERRDQLVGWTRAVERLEREAKQWMRFQSGGDGTSSGPSTSGY